MITFRTRVFENNGNWFFRWDNIAVPRACGLSEPLKTRSEAERERQQFVDAEKRRRPYLALFESE